MDYPLYYSKPDLPIAVLEAKDEAHEPGDGIQQAKRYAEELGLVFAYSTNGHGIEEFDFTTHTQGPVSQFPAPEELFVRLTQYRQAREQVPAR